MDGRGAFIHVCTSASCSWGNNKMLFCRLMLSGVKRCLWLLCLGPGWAAVTACRLQGGGHSRGRRKLLAKGRLRSLLLSRRTPYGQLPEDLWPTGTVKSSSSPTQNQCPSPGAKKTDGFLTQCRKLCLVWGLWELGWDIKSVYKFTNNSLLKKIVQGLLDWNTWYWNHCLP